MSLVLSAIKRHSYHHLLELEFRRQFTELGLITRSGRVQITKCVKNVQESTLVEDVFYKVTDFVNPFPLQMVLELYNKIGGNR